LVESASAAEVGDSVTSLVAAISTNLLRDTRLDQLQLVPATLKLSSKRQLFAYHRGKLQFLPPLEDKCPFRVISRDRSGDGVRPLSANCRHERDQKKQPRFALFLFSHSTASLRLRAQRTSSGSTRPPVRRKTSQASSRWKPPSAPAALATNAPMRSESEVVNENATAILRA
jgi:hypothetical protein